MKYPELTEPPPEKVGGVPNAEYDKWWADNERDNDGNYVGPVSRSAGRFGRMVGSSSNTTVGASFSNRGLKTGAGE